MDLIFYFFVKSAFNDVQKEEPIYSTDFLGDIGDFCEVDGVGYIITDYAEERVCWDDLINDDI